MIGHYINPLFQFGRREWDLIISDDNDNEIARIHKSFPENVTQQELDDAVNYHIEQLQEQAIIIDAPQVIETAVDLPEGTEVG